MEKREQQQEGRQQQEEDLMEESDDKRLSSWNDQITAMEHCTVALETLLLQDNVPAVVSSLIHFQEWLLKTPEEVYKDPYEHLCTDDDASMDDDEKDN